MIQKLLIILFLVSAGYSQNSNMLTLKGEAEKTIAYIPAEGKVCPVCAYEIEKVATKLKDQLEIYFLLDTD